MDKTQRILGVLYIIMYMITAIWAIIFVRTLYRDGVDSVVTNIMIGLLIVTAFSLFSLIPT